jgi:hypothetical protein
MVAEWQYCIIPEAHLDILSTTKVIKMEMHAPGRRKLNL